MTDDERPRDASWLVRHMAAMDAYRDKAMFDSRLDDDCPPEQPARKTIAVAWLPGERVRLIGGDDDEWGFVTRLVVRPGNIVYQVSWPWSKTATEHYALELEDAG